MWLHVPSNCPRCHLSNHLALAQNGQDHLCAYECVTQGHGEWGGHSLLVMCCEEMVEKEWVVLYAA